MKILAVNSLSLESQSNFDITTVNEISLNSITNINSYTYIIITGGDGTFRRAIKTLSQVHQNEKLPTILFNPTGSVNMVAKVSNTLKLNDFLKKIDKNEAIKEKDLPYYTLKGHNTDEMFFFSAGNTLDMLYIVLSELFRFKLIKNSALRYVFSFLLLLPVIILTIPFYLLSKKAFFVFSFIKLPNLGNVYFNLDKINLSLFNSTNLLQLDGDIVQIFDKNIIIEQSSSIKLAIDETKESMNE